jgi:glucosylceramidase
MKKIFSLITCLFVVIIVFAQTNKINVWLTNPSAGIFFQQQQDVVFSKTIDTIPLITVNPNQTYQTIDGFGFALTGGSAQHIMAMNAASRAALLKNLFATDGTNIGTSYLRVSIGASDLNDHVFSYDDLPNNQTDTNLVHFNLGPDLKDVVPVLKEILTINPSIKILGSPWSAPIWMKTNNDTRGGSLKKEFYAAYAKYFVKYIQAMQQQGITIDAVTVQNEPLHPGNNPSMYMPADEQVDFVKSNLGPAFRQANIKTKIIVYDHNADRPDYPISILNDKEARQYIDGSAFHLYGGTIDALTGVHNAHPDKNLYFTEQWVGAPGNFKRDIAEHIKKLIIGATRNWCRNVIEWNLAANSSWEPHTDRGGCDRCLGAVTIDADSVKKNPAYYTIAHAAKFVRPGSVRIASNLAEGLPNVAFKTPKHKIVCIVFNDTDKDKKYTIQIKNKSFSAVLPAASTATYVW